MWGLTLITKLIGKSALVSVITVLFSTSFSGISGPVVTKAPLLVNANPVTGFVVHQSPQKDLRSLAGPYTDWIREAAQKERVAPRLLAAVAYVENGDGNYVGAAHRVSSAGAIGVMQLMPVTAWQGLRVNPWNPKQNIEGAAEYLAKLLRWFHGNKKEALMAYNAGPGTVMSGQIPGEARWYARKVLRLFGGEQDV